MMGPLLGTELAALRIGLVGAGRLGQALAWSLARVGLAVSAVASRRNTNAEALAGSLNGCVATDVQGVIDRCDLVFVTTPDAAIEPTVRGGRWRPGMGVVHCSGATEVEALTKAAGDGAAVGGFHPMQTFGDPEAAARSLPGCTITIEAAEPLDAVLVGLAERLCCRVNRLPPGMRGRYHAAAGYASQFVNVLLADAARLWASWGVGEQQAIQALLPLVRGTLSAIDAVGIAQAMPGPVSRGDVASIAKHLKGIEPLDTGMQERYRLLCHGTVELAAEQGAIDEARVRQFEQLLHRG
jgi:predicted short-subunit dehydrogenase-like oxidoreductase (DUF2520 family)